MAARASVIVLIALSSVDSAVWEPVAVVKSTVETPAPAVAVAGVYAVALANPAAAKPAEVMPAIVMPVALDEDSLMLDLTTVGVKAPDVVDPVVCVSPVIELLMAVVAEAILISIFLPSAADNLTAPVSLLNSAITPVCADLALMAAVI